MKAKQVCLAVMAIALAACSGGKQSHGDERKQKEAKFVTYSMVGELPVVAHSVEVDGQEVTVSSPAVTHKGTLSDLGNIIVSGPGQKASASAFACAGTYETKS